MGAGERGRVSPAVSGAAKAVVNALGYSAFAARLPAALCSILSGVVFAALCFPLVPGSRPLDWPGHVFGSCRYSSGMDWKRGCIRRGCCSLWCRCGST